MAEPNINPGSLRARAQEIYEQKLTGEKEKPRELTRQEQELKEKIEEKAKTPSTGQLNDAVSQALSDLLTLDDQAQLSELVKLAFSKDPVFATKVARRLNNPLVVDTFHDLLAQDELFYKLVKEKRI